MNDLYTYITHNKTIFKAVPIWKNNGVHFSRINGPMGLAVDFHICEHSFITRKWIKLLRGEYDWRLNVPVQVALGALIELSVIKPTVYTGGNAKERLETLKYE